MYRSILLACALGSLSAPAMAQARNYEFDKAHTSIRASWDHQGYSIMALEFTNYEGELAIDLENPANNAVEVTLTLDGGIWPGANTGGFFDHLMSADLFNVQAFPTARFVATDFHSEDGQTGTMQGELTLLGETRPVSLFVELRQEGEVRGRHRIGVTANTTITRSEWGMDYAVPGISDWIGISIEAEIVASE